MSAKRRVPRDAGAAGAAGRFVAGLRGIYAEGGLKAFFRGNGANVVKVPPPPCRRRRRRLFLRRRYSAAAATTPPLLPPHRLISIYNTRTRTRTPSHSLTFNLSMTQHTT